MTIAAARRPTHPAAAASARPRALRTDRGRDEGVHRRPRPRHADEIWVVEHAPVFTQGLAGKAEHLLDAGDVPVVQTNRGGQVTYHGPGQVVAYPLVDLRRQGIYVKEFVFRLERRCCARWPISTSPGTACPARRAST
jgi:lipoate-protein ligase B